MNEYLPFCEDYYAPPPLPASPFFACPKNDNERLLNIQHKILCAKNKKQKDEALVLFYQKALILAKKYVAVFAKKYKSLVGKDWESLACDAVCYMVQRYIKDKYFCCKTSISGYLFVRVRHYVFEELKECYTSIEGNEGLLDSMQEDIAILNMQQRGNKPKKSKAEEDTQYLPFC